jgi:hypothetical protein
MEYRDFVERLKFNNIDLFDIEKRKLYVQIKNIQQSGGDFRNINKNNYELFFESSNKHYIINTLLKNKYELINVKFINNEYKEI